MKSLHEIGLEANNAFLTKEIEKIQAQFKDSVIKYESALGNAQALLDGKSREVLNFCEKIILLTERVAKFQALWFHAASLQKGSTPPGGGGSN